MPLASIYRMVGRGRRESRGKYFWICEICDACLGLSAHPDERDRSALAHCLGHACPSIDLWNEPAILAERAS